MLSLSRTIPTFSPQWKETDSTQLMDSKLKCVFVLPNDDGMSSAGSGAGVAAPDVGNTKTIPPSPKVRTNRTVLHWEVT